MTKAEFITWIKKADEASSLTPEWFASLLKLVHAGQVTRASAETMLRKKVETRLKFNEWVKNTIASAR